MKATIGIVGAALLCLGLTAAVANDTESAKASHIVVSDLGDRALLMSAREAKPADTMDAAAEERVRPVRTVRMVGPSFFPNE